jgi:drug/metabolite transporter (DMT)-like permease
MIAGVAEGNRPHALQWVGVAAALAGVILASSERGAGSTSKTGPRLAVFAALTLGTSLYLIGRAAEHDALTGVTVARLTAVPVLALLVLRQRATAPRAALPGLVAVGLVDSGANLAFAVATTSGMLTLVAVLGGLFPVVTVALAYFLLHERLLPHQRAGVLLALAGIPLISA